MLVRREEIHNFVPQRHPMIMIDDLVVAMETNALTATIIREDNIFSLDGKMTEPGLIENIAQTAAAQAGYQSFIRNLSAPLGFIASIKDLQIRKLPAVGARILTSIVITNQVFDVTIFNARVMCDDEEICFGEMRVFIKNKNN